VTRSKQQRNRRNADLVFYEGKNISIYDLAEKIGMIPNTSVNRIHNLGWSVEKAVSTPVRRRKARGETLPEAA
jgi:uncharacterized protein YjcR